MRKTLLSLFIIAAFVGYSFWSRHDENTKVVTPITTDQHAQSPTASSSGTATTATTMATAYKDGSYTGSAADAFYGNIQVKAIISGGKITAVSFLQSPNDRRESIEINQQALPLLEQEALKVQGARVNGVSGATDTSQAFVQSLQSALSQAT